MPIFTSGLSGKVFASLLPFSSPSLPLPDWGRRWCGYRVVDHNNGEDDGDDHDSHGAENEERAPKILEKDVNMLRNDPKRFRN